MTQSHDGPKWSRRFFASFPCDPTPVTREIVRSVIRVYNRHLNPIVCGRTKILIFAPHTPRAAQLRAHARR